MDVLIIIINVIGILITSFIGYHLYYLSKRLTFKDNWLHRKNIEEKIKKLNSEIWYENRRNRVYIVDVDTYDFYPGTAPKNRPTHIVGGLKNYHLGGVIIERSSRISVTDEYGIDIKVVKFGIIPFSWIVDIELEGDSANSSALIYCYFKNTDGKKDEGMKFTPFKSYEYYILNEEYNEATNYPWEIYSANIDLDLVKNR